MQYQFPWQSRGAISVRRVVFALVVGSLGRHGAGEEVVEQAEGVMPFERDALDGEPAVVRGNAGVDEEGGEEGEEPGQEEGQVRETGAVDLGILLFSAYRLRASGWRWNMGSIPDTDPLDRTLCNRSWRV